MHGRKTSFSMRAILYNSNKRCDSISKWLILWFVLQRPNSYYLASKTLQIFRCQIMWIIINIFWYCSNLIFIVCSTGFALFEFYSCWRRGQKTNQTDARIKLVRDRDEDMISSSMGWGACRQPSMHASGGHATLYVRAMCRNNCTVYTPLLKGRMSMYYLLSRTLCLSFKLSISDFIGGFVV